MIFTRFDANEMPMKQGKDSVERGTHLIIEKKQVECAI
jgi:hypothetical protein